jgi:hypothetical protein
MFPRVEQAAFSGGRILGDFLFSTWFISVTGLYKDDTCILFYKKVAKHFSRKSIMLLRQIYNVGHELKEGLAALSASPPHHPRFLSILPFL